MIYIKGKKEYKNITFSTLSVKTENGYMKKNEQLACEVRNNKKEKNIETNRKLILNT